MHCAGALGATTPSTAATRDLIKWGDANYRLNARPNPVDRRRLPTQRTTQSSGQTPTANATHDSIQWTGAGCQLNARPRPAGRSQPSVHSVRGLSRSMPLASRDCEGIDSPESKTEPRRAARQVARSAILVQQKTCSSVSIGIVRLLNQPDTHAHRYLRRTRRPRYIGHP
jgi:hypothetical protein